MNTYSLNNKINDVCVRTVNSYQDLLPFHKNNPQRYPYLLESVARGSSHSRFDILFAFPGETLELKNGQNSHEKLNGNILDQFDSLWEQSKNKGRCYADIPFSGGWFVFLAYELAAVIEKGLELPELDDNTPIAFFTRIPAAIIRDHQLKQTILVTEHDNKDLLDLMHADLNEYNVKNESGAAEKILSSLSEDVSEPYIDAVDKIKKYIIEGDVFQVNLSRLWQGSVTGSLTAADVYSSLRKNNPAPFAGLANYNGINIISSSPERLVKTRDGLIETRPIAGTRPRGRDHNSDDVLSEELITDPKERAEHIMLIDLERNDLGRVSKSGSVKLNELMIVETFSHVHDVTPGQVIAAVFPGGTITGCPKIRCMEILAELEKNPRGAYTGSMGYINLDGSMDLNILIRTMVMDGQSVSFRAGGGIVMDSDSQKELNETRAKARGMLIALGVEET